MAAGALAIGGLAAIELRHHDASRVVDTGWRGLWGVRAVGAAAIALGAAAVGKWWGAALAGAVALLSLGYFAFLRTAARRRRAGADPQHRA